MQGELQDNLLTDLLLMEQEQPLQLCLGTRDLACNKSAEPLHAELQVLVAQDLLIITPVDIAQAGSTVLDLLTISPQAGDPAERGPDPIEQEPLAHII